jgi:hypothetical protein
MSLTKSDPLPITLGRGVAAGLLGTVVMTAFQKFVEMPLTGRDESYAPIALVEKLTPARPKGATRRRLNYAAHFGVGATWGTVHALLARRTGLRGQAAVGTAFGVFYAGDIAGNTALGLTRPWDWSAQDLLIDVVDKLVLAEAAGLLFDRLDS